MATSHSPASPAPTSSFCIHLRPRAECDNPVCNPNAAIRREQAEADLCAEPLPALSAGLMRLFAQSAPFSSIMSVTIHYNLAHPEHAPTTEAVVWREGMMPLVIRGWVSHFGQGWQLTEAGRRAKFEASK